MKMRASKSVSRLLAFLLLSPILVYAEEPQLHQIHVVFRHGDRTPEAYPKRFPNDPYMHQTFHPIGLGGLTQEGKRRIYRLGELLRSRYQDLIDSSGRDKVFGISSEVARTKLSLQLILAALYPPKADSKWHESLDWQPIPTHYDELVNDRFFSQDRCQMFIDELARVEKLPEVQSKMRSFDGYLEELRSIVGKKSKLSLHDILILHNNLDIEQRLNLTMLPWMTTVLADKRLIEARKLFYEINSYTDRLNRIQNGPMLRKIREDMLEASSANSNSTRRVVLFSGHDKNIIGVLQSLKMYDGHFPDFASALIFELWSRHEEYYVKVHHYLGIPAEMKELTLPGCVTECPLEDYAKLSRDAENRDNELNCTIHASVYFPDEE